MQDLEWLNHRRLRIELGMRPPAEFEADYHHPELGLPPRSKGPGKSV